MIPNVYPVTDGLILRVCKTEKFKSGMVCLSVPLPIRRESAYLTTLLLSVLRRGTQKYPTLEQINRRLDYLYGTEFSIRTFYRGDCQIIGFSADLLEDRYLPQGTDLMGGVIDLMREMLFHPLLDENGLLLPRYVESEKKLQCDAILAQRNNPRGYALDLCTTLFYENEPCGARLYGSVEEVMAVTPERLTAHWRELMASLCLDVFYVGSAPAERIRSLLLRSLAPELPPKGVLTIPPTTIIRRAECVRELEEELPVSQGQLVIGLRTGCAVSDHALYACMVMNEMYGNSPISKLFVNVREKKSLCYSCSSVYYIYKGAIFVSCGIKNESRESAQKEILAQLDAIREGLFTEAELISAKRSLDNAYRQLEDSPSALESFFYGRFLAGICETVEQARAKIAAVTGEDVIRAAKQVTVDTVTFLRGSRPGEEEDDDEN